MTTKPSPAQGAKVIATGVALVSTIGLVTTYTIAQQAKLVALASQTTIPEIATTIPVAPTYPAPATPKKKVATTTTAPVETIPGSPETTTTQAPVKTTIAQAPVYVAPVATNPPPTVPPAPATTAPKTSSSK